MEEIWKQVTHKGIKYQRLVSNLGNVKSTVSGKIIAKADNGAGYLFAFLAYMSKPLGTKNVPVYIHRLVAEAFIPNPNGFPQVNHIDCDKSNNCVENLEWVSCSSNIRDAHAKGRMKKRTDNGQINVLTKEQVIDLYLSVKRDKVGISEKAWEMSIPRTTASSIINKRSRSNITDLLDIEIANGC